MAAIATLLFGDWLWSTAPVRALQAMGGWLVLPMRTITLLGDGALLVLLVPLVFWCLDRSLGIDLALLLVTSALANVALKSLFNQPRPFWSDPGLQWSAATGFSFPSGHAQNAAILGGYAISLISARRRNGDALPHGLAVTGLVLLILLIALSRVYLGVHFPGDVLWGATVGWWLLALFLALKPRLATWRRDLSPGLHMGLIVVAALLPVSLALIGLSIPAADGASHGRFYTDAQRQTLEDAANLSGVLLGLGLGLAWEVHHVRFAVRGTWQVRVLRYVIGTAVTFCVWMGIGVIIPQGPPALELSLRVVRSGLAVLWAIAAWPWLFSKVGLEDRQSS